jgi:hypothetical protein
MSTGRQSGARPADQPQRLFQILRLIAGVGYVSGIRTGAAVFVAGLPAPGHPGRQFALTPGGIRVVMPAYARGDGSPAPFALQLTLELYEELRHEFEDRQAKPPTLPIRSGSVGGFACESIRSLWAIFPGQRGRSSCRRGPPQLWLSSSVLLFSVRFFSAFVFAWLESPFWCAASH